VSATLKNHVTENRLSGEELLFPIPRRTIQGEHRRACKIAGIRDYTIHDHRHTAAVLMAKVGTPIPLIQEQLGHERIEQTMAYARFHPDYSDIRKYHKKVEEKLGFDTSVRGTVCGK
jgi:integrase